MNDHYGDPIQVKLQKGRLQHVFDQSSIDIPPKYTKPPDKLSQEKINDIAALMN